MSTNYYVKEKACEHCGRSGEAMHLGLSSIGWCFQLHVIPEEGINDLKDWKRIWRGKQIYDEYDRKITKKRMLEIITERKGNADVDNPPGKFSNWLDYFATVHDTQFGPNNLFRRTIGGNCIGHGSGTWDLIKGEFS